MVTEYITHAREAQERLFYKRLKWAIIAANKQLLEADT